jgi:predicted secreted hydrolase
MSTGQKITRKYKKHRLLRSYWLTAIIISSLLIIGIWFYYEVVGSKAAAVWFETRAASNDLISLPKDDAPHQSKIEWWYYNGHLVTEAGKKYSFHDTTFLVNSMTSQMVNHVSFADHQTGRHYIDQRSMGGNLSINSTNHFDFVSGDWNMSGGNGIDKLQASTPEFSFNLQLVSTQPPVFHGKQGVISLASAGNSYYYSRTRMAISGSIKIHGKTEAVKGVAWFDHQWGDFSTQQLSWDWFSLQLDNNSDIMIYQLRDKSSRPVLYTGSITQNGNTEILQSSDFSLSKNKKWTSDKTGISYPLEWQIKIPSKNIDIMTKNILNDSEFDATLTTYNAYWEGAVQVTGTHTGQGFMELSGYGNNTN